MFSGDNARPLLGRPPRRLAAAATSVRPADPGSDVSVTAVGVLPPGLGPIFDRMRGDPSELAIRQARFTLAAQARLERGKAWAEGMAKSAAPPGRAMYKSDARARMTSDDRQTQTLITEDEEADCVVIPQTVAELLKSLEKGLAESRRRCLTRVRTTEYGWDASHLTLEHERQALRIDLTLQEILNCEPTELTQYMNASGYNDRSRKFVRFHSLRAERRARDARRRQVKAGCVACPNCGSLIRIRENASRAKHGVMCEPRVEKAIAPDPSSYPPVILCAPY